MGKDNQLSLIQLMLFMPNRSVPLNAMADPFKNSQLCHMWSTYLEEEVQVSALTWIGWKCKSYHTLPQKSCHEGDTVTFSAKSILDWRNLP